MAKEVKPAVTVWDRETTDWEDAEENLLGC